MGNSGGFMMEYMRHSFWSFVLFFVVGIVGLAMNMADLAIILLAISITYGVGAIIHLWIVYRDIRLFNAELLKIGEKIEEAVRVSRNDKHDLRKDAKQQPGARMTG